jgi:flagella basal body P-ring formation protein FlgA
VVRITTSGSVLADASVGDTVGATVVATGRVVKVRITSPREAEVVEAL